MVDKRIRFSGYQAEIIYKDSLSSVSADQRVFKKTWPEDFSNVQKSEDNAGQQRDRLLKTNRQS